MTDSEKVRFLLLYVKLSLTLFSFTVGDSGGVSDTNDLSTDFVHSGFVFWKKRSLR